MILNYIVCNHSAQNTLLKNEIYWVVLLKVFVLLLRVMVHLLSALNNFLPNRSC